MDEATINALIDEAVLADGLRRAVKFKGRRPEGEAVIRLLPPSVWPKFGAAGEAERAALYVDKDVGWVDTLTPASYELIIELGEAINRDFFKRFQARQAAHLEATMPGVFDKMLGEVLNRLTPKTGSPSPVGSPTPRPSAA